MTRDTRHRLRGYSSGCFWGTVSGIGTSLSIIVVLLGAYSSTNEYADRQKVAARFPVTTPNAKVTIDSKQYAEGDLMDIFRGSYIVLFRSDVATVKAFVKKWGLRGGSTGKIDGYFSEEFPMQDLTAPAKGHYRTLLHKELPAYSCQGDIFDGNSFATTTLYWDAPTGTGLFYVHWAD